MVLLKKQASLAITENTGVFWDALDIESVGLFYRFLDAARLH